MNRKIIKCKSVKIWITMRLKVEVFWITSSLVTKHDITTMSIRNKTIAQWVAKKKLKFSKEKLQDAVMSKQSDMQYLFEWERHDLHGFLGSHTN